MQPENVSRRTLVIVVLAGLSLSTAFLLYIARIREVRNDSVPLPSQNPDVLTKTEQVNLGLPVRLKIPKIKVDAAIEHVGLTPEGAVDAPKDPANAAWFDRGPRPGEDGSSVIDGHFGWKGGLPAVFDDLHKLEKGDKVYVEDEQGKITTFVVRELRSYGEGGNTVSVFGSSDGSAHLNLITCGGVWNKAEKSYSTRLVAFTDREVEVE